MTVVSALLVFDCLSQSLEPQSPTAFGGINLQSSYGVLDISSPMVIDAGHYVVGGLFIFSSQTPYSHSGMTGSLGFGLAKYSQLNFSYSSGADKQSDYRSLTLSLKGNVLEETVPLSVELSGSRIEILSQADSLNVESAGILRLIGSTGGIGDSRMYFHGGYILTSKRLPKRSRVLAGAGVTVPVTRTLGLAAEIQMSERPTDSGIIKGGIGLKWFASHIQVTLGFHATSFSRQVSSGISLGLHISSEMLQESSPAFETEDSLVIPPSLEDLEPDSVLRKTNVKNQNESFLQLRGGDQSHTSVPGSNTLYQRIEALPLYATLQMKRGTHYERSRT